MQPEGEGSEKAAVYVRVCLCQGGPGDAAQMAEWLNEQGCGPILTAIMADGAHILMAPDGQCCRAVEALAGRQLQHRRRHGHPVAGDVAGALAQPRHQHEVPGNRIIREG